MIGDFTAFTEVKKDDSDLGLSAAACEHVIRVHTLDCEPAAENRAKREIRAMSLLLKMLKGDDWQIFDGHEERELVICMLNQIPPELCDIRHETDVGELQKVLASNAYPTGRSGAEDRLRAFHAKVSANSVSVTRIEELVTKAISDAADAAWRILDAHQNGGRPHDSRCSCPGNAQTSIQKRRLCRNHIGALKAECGFSATHTLGHHRL